MQRPMQIRPMTAEDLPGVLALNQAEVPAVGHLDLPALTELWAQCAPAWVAERQGELAGFVLALRPGAAYTSPNFLWFTQRYETLLYVDRIAVAPWARRQGLGLDLYRRLSTFKLPIACEVNTRPLNQESLDFHAKAGFEAVGEGQAKGKGVRYLLRPVRPTPAPASGDSCP